MKKFLKITIKVIAGCINIFFSLMSLMLVAILGAISEKGWQLVLFIIANFSFISIIWYSFLSKIVIWKKIPLVIIGFSMFYFSFYIPEIKKANDLETCLDVGICAQGLETNTEYGRVEINEDNCLKYQWEWDEKGKTCYVR